MADQNTQIPNISNNTTRSAEALLKAALSSKGLRYVGTRGNTRSPVCIIGEAPGQEEDRVGYPFIGYSGQLLDKMISEGGFNASDVWFTNPYKTKPPDNDIKRIEEYGIQNNLFTDQFFEELRQFKPTILVACGKTATNLLCPETKPKAYKGKEDEKEGFMSWRGSLLISPFLDWPHYVIPMAHPAYVLRNYSEREICIFVLSRAYEEFTYWNKNKLLQPLPKMNLLINPSFGDAYDYLRRCINSPSYISVDIELLRRRVPYTISFAPSIDSAISMSFWNYPANQCANLWKQMDKIFSESKMIMQNGTSFDCHWLRAMGFNINLNNVEDTLIRHHVLWPGLRHKLEFQTFQYTRLPFYKWEGRGWSLKDGLDRLMKYNCLDTIATYQIFLAQQEEFNERI
jgi:uracil-DNA glycosylase family 4